MKNESMADLVYEAVILRLLSGEYRPGMAINRREVAASLEVSISPVSEAFAILKTEGILVTNPRKETFIGKLDWRDIQDLMDVRAALESQAARIYCGLQISKRKSEILLLAQDVDSAPPVSFEYLRADVTFHRELVKLAGNQYLCDLFDQVITRSMLLAMEGIMAIRPIATEVLSHRILVQELSHASAADADKIIRKNIYSGKEPILKRIDPSAGSYELGVNSRSTSALDVVLASLGSRIK